MTIKVDLTTTEATCDEVQAFLEAKFPGAKVEYQCKAQSRVIEDVDGQPLMGHYATGISFSVHIPGPLMNREAEIAASKEIPEPDPEVQP